ncbi:MAG TPA: response regulator [Candidatus Acidoferrum sp.]|nr:response regulator [Candidatus Acidoferrum sp.]
MAPRQDRATLSKRILVADDDQAIRELISVFLIRSGYEVDTVKDGADAWKALNEASYYMLITDYKMPRMTGVELINLLRSQDMTLPVILVSGTMPTEELNRRPWLRVDATLHKPFTLEELLDTVNNVMNKLIETPFADLMSYPEKLETSLNTSATPQTQEPANAPVREQRNPPHHILVVDDNNETRLSNIDLLARAGYDVEGVKDGAAGWEALQNCEFDLVITDNVMPRMTGIEMIAKLYSTRLSLPVIMATGHLPTHEFASKPWLTPDATLERPFSNDDLLATVKRVLRTDEGNKTHMEMQLSKYL